MALRDHQPDIRFQGDGLARGLHRATARVACLTRNISIELQAIKTHRDPARKAAGRVWIAQAQGARREALHAERAYRALIAERDQQHKLLGDRAA